MAEILVSVVMPLFNKEAAVGRAVRSVLGQTRAEFELIVVNDGSTDGSLAAVASLRDHRVRVIDQVNGGVSAARNRGIAAAGAELIAFCDADDEWEPDHLETILGLAERFPGAEVFAAGYFIADRAGRRRTNLLRGLPGDFEQGCLENYFSLAAASDPPLNSSCVAATRRALRAVGLFPLGIATGEDLLTWARLAASFRIAYQRRPTTTFHSPGRAADRPGRVPAEPDVVGAELARMLPGARDPADDGLAAYLALWLRMRGVIYLKLGNCRRARGEFGRSLHQGGRGSRRGAVRALWLLTFLPLSGRLLESSEGLRNRMRGARR